MSLQACQKCGYALSVADHQCRHCFGLTQKFSKVTTRDVTLIGGAVSIAIAVGLLIYRTLTG